MPLLGYTEEQKLIDQALDAQLFDTDNRRLLFRRLERLRGEIPAAAAPANQLRQDVAFLNSSDRPIEGQPPLLIWIINARSLVAGRAQQDYFERLIAAHGGEAGGSTLPASETTHDEAILFEDDMLPGAYLERGFEVSASVARLLTPRIDNGTTDPARSYWGTGWLLGPDLIITNHHVFNARGEGEPPASDSDWNKQALATAVQFDVTAVDQVVTGRPIHEVVAFDKKLDFCVVRIDPVTDRKPLRLDPSPLAITKGDVVPLNIIQHPNGQPRKIAIRNNLATDSALPTVRYFTSTYGGSSGAPVFNDLWNVVAIHRGSVGTTVKSFQGRTTAIVNIGTQIHSVVEALPPAVKAAIGL